MRSRRSVTTTAPAVDAPSKITTLEVAEQGDGHLVVAEAETRLDPADLAARRCLQS